MGDILREALKVQAPTVKNTFNRGYERAKHHYCITYKCSVCGMPIELSSEKEKKETAQYMTEHGWAHDDCLK